MNNRDTILLAGGTAEHRKMLRAVLKESYNLLEAANTQQAILLLQQNSHCIAAAILDITSPKKLSNKVLLQSDFTAALDHAPVIVITPNDDPDTLSAAFGFGAADAIPITYDPFAMLHRIENIVQLHLHRQQLEELVAEQASALQQSNDVIVDTLSSIIEYRSVESGQHILRIRHFTQILLEELAVFCPEYGLTPQMIRIISSASALHDVGKIAIPDAILTKPGKLTPEEMEIMKTHSVTGCQILQGLGKAVNQEYLRYAYDICRYHHERWDGKGYPDGLIGDAIPICAQVVGLADVYDALTSRRVYKDAFSSEVAVNMILQGDCGVFSPKLLECFKHVAGKYMALCMAYADGKTPDVHAFDAQIPSTPLDIDNDGVARTWAKYQALVHYANAFLLELDLDQNLFHLVYNPFPDIVSFYDISTFSEVQNLILDTLVVPEDRERMHRMIFTDIEAFVDARLRRVNYSFRFRSKRHPNGDNYEVTLLRINPIESNRRTLAILCRKAGTAPALAASSVAPIADSSIFNIAENAYRCRCDKDFTFLELGDEQAGLLGYTVQQLKEDLGGRLIELVHPDDRQMVIAEFHRQLQFGTNVQLEHRVVHKSGHVLWVLNKSRLLIDPDGQESLHCYPVDITIHKAAAEELNNRINRYEIILAQTENILFDWDIATDAINFSGTWEKVFGFAADPTPFREALMGGAYFHPDDLPLLLDRLRNLEHGSAYEMFELRMITANSQYLWCRIRASAIRDEEGNLQKIVGIIINVDDEKQMEQALQDRAERDSLTKLLNKNASRKQAEEYFQQFAHNLNCALLIIDLDDFKLVNDRYGHLFGDAVLTTVAKEIRHLFRNQDIIARIGGDEFMVLMRGTSDRSLVQDRCNRLLDTLKTAFRDQHLSLPLSCSIGVALAPEHSGTYLTLFQQADQALYQAKRNGKNTMAFYNPKEAYLLQDQATVSSINNRIDSDEEPGLADSNLVHHAFQRLYSADNEDAAINDILHLVGRQMNVSRAYIFENSSDGRFCTNTYEWCNEGIAPVIQTMQHVAYNVDLPDFTDRFNEDGVIYCPDVKELPEPFRSYLSNLNTQSLLLCAMRDKGVFRGFVGFSDCVTTRLWTKEQLHVLTYFSETLTVFLMKKRAQEQLLRPVCDLGSILTNRDTWGYVIDLETCELKYLNEKTRNSVPDIVPGMRCHKVFFGSDVRCKHCPARDLHPDQVAAASFYIPKFGANALAEATPVRWNGAESCLLTVRELPDDERK